MAYFCVFPGESCKEVAFLDVLWVVWNGTRPTVNYLNSSDCQLTTVNFQGNSWDLTKRSKLILYLHQCFQIVDSCMRGHVKVDSRCGPSVILGKGSSFFDRCCTFK